MATLREFLDQAHFDWNTGKIIVQLTEEEDGSQGWNTPVSAKWIEKDDPILDKKFSDGFGGPECPRFIAEDAESLYFPYQYDGATGPVAVFKKIERYLDPKVESPYPGG